MIASNVRTSNENRPSHRAVTMEGRYVIQWRDVMYIHQVPDFQLHIVVVHVLCREHDKAQRPQSVKN